MKFRTGDVEVDAVQITHEWFTGPHPNPLHLVGVRIDPQTRTVEILTPKSVVIGQLGDWIITSVKGERTLCKPDIFEATYKPIEQGAEAKAK